MTKQQLIERVYKAQRGRRNGLGPSKRAVTEIVDSVFAELGEYFVKAKITRAVHPRFSYPGFGTFTKRRKAERTGRHPRTHEPITIPAVVTVTFSPGQDLRELLNRAAPAAQKKLG
jgi:nucleoid DNA-binding protein